MSKLLEKIEYFKNNCQELFNLNKEHPPLFFLETDSEEITIMPVIFTNDEEKDKIVWILKELIKKGKVLGFIFVSEAWTKTVENFNDIKEDYKKHGSLKFAAGREEVLMMQYQSFGNNLLLKAKINRDGNDVFLAEWEELKGKSDMFFGGRFDNLFDKSMAAFN